MIMGSRPRAGKRWVRRRPVARPRVPAFGTAGAAGDCGVSQGRLRVGEWEPRLQPTPATAFLPEYLLSESDLEQRPVIGDAPTTVWYCDDFTVGISEKSPVPAQGIGKVALVRVTAVTHAFGEEKCTLSLGFFVTPGEAQLSVEAPTSSDLAPPGYYMLFVISEAAWYLKVAQGELP